MESAEIELFTLFEMTPDLVCIASKAGYFKKVNPAVIQKLGYTEDELFAVPISTFIHPEDRNVTHENRKELLDGKALLNFENRYVSKTGTVLWLEWTSIYFPGKEIVFAIAKDVTQRKQIEKQVEEKYKKFKSLATHFKTSIEKDRKYLAYELHEELAQLVSALKLDLDSLANNEPDLPHQSKERIEHALAVSKLLTKTIQRISFSISPNMLDDFGLDTTLEWLCKDFSILNSIPCSFESSYHEKAVSHEVKIDFFRICQEALTNVIDHSKATDVKIRIEDANGKINLSIIDNGRGFDIDQKKASAGLIDMRERAASINGSLRIYSKPGKGTKISITVNKE